MASGSFVVDMAGASAAAWVEKREASAGSRRAVWHRRLAAPFPVDLIVRTPNEMA
jgi:hypothetical protein